MHEAQASNISPASSPVKKRGLLNSLLLVSAVGVLCSVYLIYQYIQYRADIIAEAQSELKLHTLNAVDEIENILHKVTHDADAIAKDLSEKQLTKASMLERLEQTIRENPTYFGGTITFKAFAAKEFGFAPERELYSAYYKRSIDTQELEFVQLENIYDYRDHDWYAIPMQKGNLWVEPYWGPAGKTFMTTYSSVFYHTDAKSGAKTPLGIVTIDLSMDQIKSIIESLDLGPSGFGALVSEKGVYLHHPNNEYVLQQMNIDKVAREKNDKDRIIMAKKSAQGEGGILDHISTTTGRKSWLVFEPVKSTGWSLQNTFLKDDLPIDVDVIRHQLIWIVMTVMATLLCLLLFYLFNGPGTVKRIWLVTGLGSIIMAAAVLSIWLVSLEYNPGREILGTRITDKASLLEIMNDNTRHAEENHLPTPIYIPTGLYIDSIDITMTNDVFVAGYIWQKYQKDLPDKIKKSFTISRTNELEITKLDSKEEKDHEIVRYQFRVEIRHKLNPNRYPLEKEYLRLNIINTELQSNIVLVPDLDAYTLLNPSLLPGLDKGSFISGWSFKNSYYALVKHKIGTSFGEKKTIEKDQYLALYYNIEIQRDFVDAFISNLTPLIIVYVLLFFLLLMSKNIDTTRVFSICVAMFFVIVFSHLDIRRKISAHEIFYLEYFFFLTYLAILWVAINSMAVLVDSKLGFFHHRENLLPKVLFWPIFLGTIILVTVATFY